jgi:4,4'-diaponeurosporenoate glycosyltransferase
VLPYHVTRKPYEELSLFFNLLTAFGAGGFGVLGGGRLFGQSLLISRRLYAASGGHEAVKQRILENLAMSAPIMQAGGRCLCLGGRGALNIRMFPDGFDQLCEGWTKAFADGAAASNGAVLAITIYWLTALSLDVVMLLNESTRPIAAFLYLVFAVQVIWFARQIGAYRLLTCALYPLPLIFFFSLFTRSLLRKTLKRQVTWRGRQL